MNGQPTPGSSTRTTASGGASRLICPARSRNVVLVVSADEEELPAPHHRQALIFQLARQRDRLAVRRELNPSLPSAGPGGQGLGGFRVHEPLVLHLPLGFGLRYRDVRTLPLLLDGMPSMQRELRLNVMLSQHVAGDPLSLRGGNLGSCVQEDLRITRADDDGLAELAADVFFHLMPGQRPLRLSGLRLSGQGDGYPPVIAVCHVTTLTHPSQATGWPGAAWWWPGHEWTWVHSLQFQRRLPHQLWHGCTLRADLDGGARRRR